MEVAQEETEKESVLEEESAKFETKNESEVKDTPDFENPTSDIFKKPQLIIGPRRGKVIGKIRSLENKPQEEPAETEEKEIDVTDSNLTDSVETDASVVKTVEIKSCNTVSPAQKIKESSIPLPYKEPKWSGIPEEDYGFEVLKSGKILENIKLNSKSFYVFGRLSTCDIRMAHPTISRYHAVLQYRSQENENDGVGFYIYDLGSTHGTFLNKNRIKPNMYVRVQVGHILKLGLSTRLFVLQGPEKDMEEESELTVTQMKEKRKLELAARELEELEQQRIEEERKQREEEEGIDWGMGEDADEETDLTENPFAATQNEELYINDPKKTLRGWFEREGYDLEYDVEEKGFGQFLCRVELPIESTRGCNVMAEALVKGKKKESVVQCALEACRILDRYGLLRQATHESKKRKAKNWEAEDFYDSDEDTFLDRTGTVEKKRQQRMRAAGKKDPTEVVETYDSLMRPEDVARAVALYDDGRSVRYIANVMNMARSTTHDAIKRYRETLEYTRRPGSGRPSATNPNEDRYMVLRVLRERILPATSVAQQFINMHGRPISAKTVRRRLKASGLISSRPATGPRLLSRMHRVEQLRFANDHRDWRNGQWSCVLFTDESRFNLCSPDGRERVWRRRGERFSQCCISENVPYGVVGVMVWAGVCTDARTELVFVENGRLTADRYITECLADHVPFGQFVGDNFVLMHDNAWPHFAHAVGDYLQEVGIHVLPWPARSPDMNPIEHVWDMLGRHVKNRRPRPESLQELRRALGEEWELIPQEDIANQIESMPRRMDAVIQARWSNTRY
ncbi:hypothetical protein ANN_07423 [Periplaneta americana]|uniref:FHA domain-containing protein n=1 Tax=Periplaneta americana TaxID=6978 RepID=A0ABQ8SYP6_PERAM|nr:hypothetical protein ANN_07423 [Periplaneta americana]